MRPLCRLLADLLFAVSVLALIGTVHADVVWDEDVHGELSNNHLSPTSINLAAGSNFLIASMENDFPNIDRDYFTVNVPENHVLSALMMLEHQGDDPVTFIGVQAGAQMTVPPDTLTDAGLLGWRHVSEGLVDVDILPLIGDNPSHFLATGFVPPLASGPYTFWIQQTEADFVNVEYDFQVTALEPPGIPGDYNNDNRVDAGDYVRWRNNLGDETEDDIFHNGDGGDVGISDYTWWKDRYGDPGGGAGGLASVPEPAIAALLLAAAVAVSIRRRSPPPSQS